MSAPIAPLDRMTPAQIRDAVWADLQANLNERRRAVYEAFKKYGPATTLQIAAIAGIGLLTLRPRTSELMEMGLLECVGRLPEGGVYKAVEMEEAAKRVAVARVAAGEQLQML